MRKKIITALTALVLAGAVSITTFAGQWKQDTAGWWYENDDGSYPDNGWNWVDGKCYYFNSDGYCLLNTRTPDGYTVDDSGAWIVDGVIQTQGEVNQASGNSMQIDSIYFTAPPGYTFSSSGESGYYFTSADYNSVIGIVSKVIPDKEAYGNLLDQYQETLLDIAMEELTEEIGAPHVKSLNQFSSGTWYCYYYADASSMGIPGSLKIYARLSGGRVQLLLFSGMISSLDTDTIMNTCVR